MTDIRLIDADALRKKLWEELHDRLMQGFGKGLMLANSCVIHAPTIEPEPHWIPVTETTLPDKHRVVVVCGKKGTWDYGTYRGHGDDIHFWHWKKNTYKYVYWWMYKEDAITLPYREEG